MVIYIDVLLFVNFFIDLLLIRLTAIIAGNKIRFKRLILSALLAAAFSLYIFLPNGGVLLELLMKAVSSIAIVTAAFGFYNWRRFLRAFGTFFAVSFIFAGAILGLKQIMPHSQVQVNNGVVYFDISPVVLIALTFIIYVVIYLVRRLTAKTAATSNRYKVKIKLSDNNIECAAISDSGHTLTDAFGDSMVIVIDKQTAESLFGTFNCSCMLSLMPPEGVLKERFRLIPVKTVSGEKMLPAVRCDTLEIFDDKGKLTVTERYPVAVLSESSLGDDFSVILPVIIS